VLDRQSIAEIEMAMRWSNVGGEEVGVKCGCMQGCCVGANPGVRSWWSMAGSGEHEKKQSRRCRAPIVGVTKNPLLAPR